jgi:hypothetical protein
MSLWYFWRKPCTYIASTQTLSPNEPKRDSTWPTHLRVPSGATKTISVPTVLSVQTAHLSCTKTSTISKQNQTWFHLNLVPSCIIGCVQKQFLRVWYIRRKPCTYLALTLTWSPNGTKRDATWLMSPRRSILAHPKQFSSISYISANHDRTVTSFPLNHIT